MRQRSFRSLTDPGLSRPNRASTSFCIQLAQLLCAELEGSEAASYDGRNPRLYPNHLDNSLHESIFGGLLRSLGSGLPPGKADLADREAC